MNSNKTTNSKGSRLSREDIETYRSTTDERMKHSIEKDALENDFDSDALEGWSDKRLPLSQMNNLDKRFRSSNRLNFFISGLIAIVFIVGAIAIFQNQTTKTPEKQLVQQSITLEKTDLITPSIIEDMEELPLKEQIAIKTIVKDFSDQQKTESLNPIIQIEIDNLPIKKIEPASPEAKILKETILGKEVYLKNLKLLDYRVYRSKPKITTKQMVFTGTPANKEDNKSSEDEIVWNDVDVPYIDYLEKTMEYFSKGNNKKALTRFIVILETYPDDLNANFYAGLCYFNLKEYANASRSFDMCIDSKFINFKEEAEWYYAKSKLADGKTEEAKRKLSEIASNNGFYASQAKKMLASL